ncbi:MAG: hypothetical protein ABR915_01170, partial [Thermoguttaceae bacterium]
MKWIAASVMGIAAMTALASRAEAAEEYHAFTLVLDSPPDGGFDRPQWTLEGGFVKGVAQLEKTLVKQPPNAFRFSTIREGTLTLDGKGLKGQF